MGSGCEQASKSMAGSSITNLVMVPSAMRMVWVSCHTTPDPLKAPQWAWVLRQAAHCLAHP